MKRYQKLFIGLSLLVFISCGSSGGGGGHDKSTNVTPIPPKEEVTPPEETTPPKEEVTPPEETTPPKEEVTPPEEEVTPPVNGEILKKGEISTSPIVAKNGEIQTSNGDTNINDKTKVAMTAEDGGQITNGTDGTISGVFAVGIKASGTDSKIVNDGKIIGGSSENTVRLVALNSNEEINKIGMKASNGGEAVNNGEISGKLTEGMAADGKNSFTINHGKISSTGFQNTYTYTDKNGIKYNGTRISAIGMKASNGAFILNEKDGVIFGTISEGMRADGEGSTAANNGEISSTGTKYGETYIKDGIEYNEMGISAIGMKASKGGSVTNEKDGVISGAIGEGMGADGEGSTAANNGEISSTGTKYDETYIKDGIEYNEMGISATGMKAYEGSSVNNFEDGIISGTISSGMSAKGKKSFAFNYGIINTDGALFIETYDWELGKEHKHETLQGRGMYAKDEGSVMNNAEILGNISEGMKAKGTGSVAINNGIIDTNGVESIESFVRSKGVLETIIKTSTVGMYAVESGSITNNNIISGVINEGMNAKDVGSLAINNGEISSTGGKYTKIYIKDGIKYNETKTESTGMTASNGGKVINEKDGVIFGIIKEGMIAEGSESSAVNHGDINFTESKLNGTYTDENGIVYIYSKTENTTGMIAENGATITNGKTGFIFGSIDEVMTADGKSSAAINNGNISSTGVEQTETYTDNKGIMHKTLETYGATGMIAENGATVTNGETGSIFGTIGQGMVADGEGSTAANNGGISSTGATYSYTSINGKHSEVYAIGMSALYGATATNEKYGTINLNSVNGVGMKAKGRVYENGQPTEVKGIAKNYGTININSSNGKGMLAFDGGAAINEEGAFINLNSSNGIGMYATGEGATIENRGTIYLSGSEVTPSRDTQTAEDIAINGEMINGKDSKGNIGMKIDSGARMINKGHITFGK